MCVHRPLCYLSRDVSGCFESAGWSGNLIKEVKVLAHYVLKTV